MTAARPRPLLFLLAHAGGSAAVYQTAFKRLAARFEIVALELPGHGRRINEPLLTSLELMVADLGRQVERVLAAATDYVIFGHSLGGLAAFLLAGEISSRGLPPPARLIISSACVPGSHRVNPALLTLSDANLWRASADYFGALNHEALDSEELMLLFAPILRADLQAVLDYKPRGGFRPLDIPLAAVFAEGDIVSLEDMNRWRSFAVHPVSVSKLTGGHFHPLVNPAAVEELILQHDSGTRTP